MTLKHKLLIAIGLIAVAVLGRVVPHLWNMTPVAAVALIAGARLGWRWGVGIPVISMVIGDLIIGFYSLPVVFIVYGSFIITGLVGYLVREKGKATIILGGTVFSTLLFFFATNAAVWYFGTMYPHNISGLMLSYIAGLPFLQNQLIGDLFFTSALFAVWEVGKILAARLNFKEKSVPLPIEG